MILTCPRCATRYLADADQLWTTGRTVQCDACGQRWRESGSGLRPPPPQPPPPPAQQPPAEPPIETASGVPVEPSVPTPVETAPEAPSEPEPPSEPSAEQDAEAEPAPEPPRESVLKTPSPEPEFDPMPAFTPLEAPPRVATPAAPAVEAEPALFLQPRKTAPYSDNGPAGLGRALAILFLIAMAVAVLVLFKDAIIQAAPGLAPIYSALGLSTFSLTGVGAHG